MDTFFKRPWLIVAVIGAITVFFALQLPRAQLDNNNFRFVPENDAERLALKNVDDSFGSQIIIMVGLEREGDSILDADFLSRLRVFGQQVEDLAVVDTVTSVVSTDYIGGSAEGISVEPLVSEDFTGTKEEIAAVRDRLLEWDMYRRALVSDDFSSTQLIVTLDLTADNAGSPESVASYNDIRRLADEAGFKNTRVYITGLPVLSSEVNEAMRADLRVLIPLVVFAVLLVLFLSFRKLSGLILPILTVTISATWAIGAMALLGVKLTIISTVLPVILVAVGSAYCIHVVSHYYDELALRRNLSREEHRRVIFTVLKKYGKPVFLAAFTDGTGFLALCFTPVVPIHDFGLFSTFGILVAFLVAMTLIPSLLLIRGPAAPASGAGERARESGPSREGVDDPLSVAIADAFCAITRKRRTVVAFSLLIVGISAFGISRLVIDNVMVEYFKSDTEVVKSDEFIRNQFGGSKTVSVVVRGEKGGDVLRPDVLAAMDGLSTYLTKEVPEVGKTTGFTDLVKRINQVFNADESPEGIARVEETTGGDTATAFGFGEGEDTGFGFAAVQESADAKSAAREAATTKAAPSSEPLDEVKLVSLLSEALAGGGKRDQSADELVASLARALNYRGAAYYEIPTDPARYGKRDAEGLKALIANYLVLLSSDISTWADDPLEPKAIRMNVQLRTVGQLDTDRAIHAIERYVSANFPKDVKVEIAGTALVEASLNRLVVQSQLSSLPLSLFLVFLTLSLFYRTPVAGLIGIVPLCISILINFGVMGVFGIKLNIGTAMVASIAVGIGIDYTIHYLAAYHREYARRTEEGADFIRHTFLTSGKAIIFNAASVGLGFVVLAFSQFRILADLGILMALTMITSAAVSLTVLPVLLELVQPAFIKRPLPFEKNGVNSEENK